MWSRALASGRRLGWPWPLSVGAPVVAGWAVLGRHCCSQVLVFSSDGVACQGFERFWAELSPRAATRTMASCTLTSLPTYDYYAEGKYR